MRAGSEQLILNTCATQQVTDHLVSLSTGSLLDLLYFRFTASNTDPLILIGEVDGHDIPPIVDALKRANDETSKPSVIIAHTVKGKGISFMEGDPKWHGSVKLTDDHIATSLTELGLAPEKILECTGVHVTRD